ncbi:MAG: hypothetical protein ACTHOJ_13235, partial [Sphingomonas oligoaromativorans]
RDANAANPQCAAGWGPAKKGRPRSAPPRASLAEYNAAAGGSALADRLGVDGAIIRNAGIIVILAKMSFVVFAPLLFDRDQPRKRARRSRRLAR